MSPVPFPLWRPVLLVQGPLLDRSEPDLGYLGSIDDPEFFGWAILPHVARSFAASIALLPQGLASAALVGHLYARLLDTYEDMVPDPTRMIEGLEWFADGSRPGSRLSRLLRWRWPRRGSSQWAAG